VTTGVYATLRLLGAGVVVSAVCASVPLVLGPLWRPLVSGLITAQTGLALTPAIAVLVALALRRERSRRLAVLGGLGVAGVILTHTYDILAVALLTLLMAATMRVLRARLRTLVHGVALLGGTAAAALWPWLDGISRAAGERGQVPPAFPGDPLAAAAWWFLEPASYLPFSIELQAPAPGVITWVEPTSPAGVFVAVARALVLVSPLAFFVRELRWARPWIGLLAVAGAVGTVTMSTSGPARDAVAGLWYGDAARVLFMVAPAYGVAACAGGCVVATLVRRAAGPAVPPALRRSRPVRWMQARGVTSATAAIGIGSVTTASLLMSLASAWRPADTVFRQFAPLDPGMRRTYGWLADRLQPGEVVADDVHRELVTWGYADAGIGLLFGLVPIDPAAQRDWDARRMAWYWLVGVARTDHGCLVRHYRIRYVVVSERPIPAGRSRYVSSLLETPRNVELVHVDGPARVYEVTERGRRCPDETTRQADRSGARTTQTVSRGIVVSSLRSTS
jgi:hypothetical protein